MVRRGLSLVVVLVWASVLLTPVLAEYLQTGTQYSVYMYQHLDDGLDYYLGWDGSKLILSPGQFPGYPGNYGSLSSGDPYVLTFKLNAPSSIYRAPAVSIQVSSTLYVTIGTGTGEPYALQSGSPPVCGVTTSTTPNTLATIINGNSDTTRIMVFAYLQTNTSYNAQMYTMSDNCFLTPDPAVWSVRLVPSSIDQMPTLPATFPCTTNLGPGTISTLYGSCCGTNGVCSNAGTYAPGGQYGPDLNTCEAYIYYARQCRTSYTDLSSPLCLAGTSLNNPYPAYNVCGHVSGWQADKVAATVSSGDITCGAVVKALTRCAMNEKNGVALPSGLSWASFSNTSPGVCWLYAQSFTTCLANIVGQQTLSQIMSMHLFSNWGGRIFMASDSRLNVNIQYCMFYQSVQRNCVWEPEQFLLSLQNFNTHHSDSVSMIGDLHGQSHIFYLGQSSTYQALWNAVSGSLPTTS